MNNKLLLTTAIAAFLAATSAQAHIVGLGYTFIGSDIKFDALHWHSSHEAAGYLNVNGVDYDFTSHTWNTETMTGLDGALVNSTYSSYDSDAGVLSAIRAEDDWMHVWVPNPGTETISLSTVYGPGGLTAWTLDDQITSLIIEQPDSVPVPEPATLGLLGLGMLGLGARRRMSRKRQSV